MPLNNFYGSNQIPVFEVGAKISYFVLRKAKIQTSISNTVERLDFKIKLMDCGLIKAIK